MNVAEAKKDLAIKTKRGLPIILAGVFILGSYEYNRICSF
ncbi:Uncharacterized protein B5E39_4948 [Bacillus cereus]|nr:Uncharacterized protein B5E39_4948 [Bacillus cereus]